NQDQVDHQAGAAVTEQRQGQPLGRKRTQVDADIDERLQHQPADEAIGDKAVEQLTALEGAPGDGKHAPQHQQKKTNDQQRADQAEFLGINREQEIRVRLRQIQQLLHGIAQPDAKNAAAADGNQ